MEMSKYPCDVSMWRYMDHKTGSTVFGLSERDQPRENCNSQCVKYKGNEKSLGCIVSNVVATSTNTSDFQKSSFADVIGVFFSQTDPCLGRNEGF